MQPNVDMIQKECGFNQTETVYCLIIRDFEKVYQQMHIRLSNSMNLIRASHV